MKLIGIDSSHLRDRIAKSVLLSSPPSELGEWLSYRRAEPEWSLSEWLGSNASQFSVPSPRPAFTALAQKIVKIAEPALPSSRLQNMSSFGGARVFDER